MANVRTENVCVICSSNSTKVIANNIRGIEGVKVYYCEQCDIAFIDEKYAERNEKQFYNEVYPEIINPIHKGTSPVDVVLARMERCMKYLARRNKQGKALEIGCASGAFLASIQEYFDSVVGCDLNREHCAYVKSKYGIECHNMDIREMGQDGEFDFIFMFQLLEHISKPHDFLAKVSSLLKPQGMLILDVPNLNEPLFRLYRLPMIKEGFFFKPQHPVTYSPKSLNKIMSMHKLAEIETKLVQNYSITNHLNWIYYMRGNNSFESGMDVCFDNLIENDYSPIWQELNLIYRQLLLQKGFSDIIFSVYKKDS